MSGAVNEPLRYPNSSDEPYTARRSVVLLDTLQTTVPAIFPNYIPKKLIKSWLGIANRLWRIRQHDPDFRGRAKRFVDCMSDYNVYYSEKLDQFKCKPLRCYDPLCPVCSNALAKKMTQRFKFHITRMKHPNLWTFTFKSDQRSAKEAKERAVECFRKLRKTRLWKEHVRGGLWSYELTWNEEIQRWHPHLHMVLDSSFLPWEAVKEKWMEITGDSFIVHFEPVRNKEKTAAYLSKYLTKSIPTGNLTDNEFIDLLRATRGKKRWGTFGSAYCRKIPDLFEDIIVDDFKYIGRFSNRYFWSKLGIPWEKAFWGAVEQVELDQKVALDFSLQEDLNHSPDQEPPPDTS